MAETTQDAVDAWESRLILFSNRDEVAAEYASLIEAKGVEWDGYSTLNEAILRRWSIAGLQYIKEQAWRKVGKDVAQQRASEEKQSTVEVSGKGPTATPRSQASAPGDGG